MRCDGCRAGGRLADTDRKARPCVRERGVEFCADCDEFPCDKVRHLMTTREGMLLFYYPRTSGMTREEYDTCMRQFESMPNVLRRLVALVRIDPGLAGPAHPRGS